MLGAGAVGGSIGGLLARNGTAVVLVARGAHGEAIRANGLRLRTPDGDTLVRAPCVARVGEVRWRAGDVALLATKLGDAEALLDELRAAAPDVPVVCATNGLAAERWASERFAQVVSMVVWLPGLHLEPGEVRLHAGPCRGVLDCGLHPEGVTPLVRELCARLTDAGFDAEPRADCARWKRAKLVTNLGGAAQALLEGDWMQVAALAREEGVAVLRAAGLDHVGAEALLERTKDVRDLEVGGEARPGGSTWQSARRGRPLESPWIEGEIVRLAEAARCGAPVCRALVELALAARPESVEAFLARIPRES